jgi:hypothetical protein
VKGPAIGLIVLAGISIAMGLFDMLATALGFAASMSEQLLKSLPPDTPPELRQIFADSASGTAATYAFGIVGLALQAFVVYGALQMMKLQNWALALAASIIVMIPCIGTANCCCVFGIPLGIWSLVVLLNRDVKAAFASTAGTAEPPL